MKSEYEKDGFVVCNNLCTQIQVDDALEAVKMQISSCAQELQCEERDYLRAVSRWVAPSPVVTILDQLIKETITPFMENFVGTPLQLVKANVISKSAYATGAVPCHQDISYSPKNPYEISAWLALNDVSLNSGVIEMLPGSHREPISKAIDFWDPTFIDEKSVSEQWKKKAVKLPVSAGDVILFDSRTWHRSAPSLEKRDRYALVTRWKGLKESPTLAIPEIEKSPFGMWTCYDRTNQILSQGLPNDKKTDSFVDLIDLWTDLLSTGRADIVCHRSEAISSLQMVRILHLAAERHHGGDAHGKIYASLWNHLLKPLEESFAN